jgi:hypothetical protein
MLHERGVAFALMLVADDVINNPLERAKAAAWGSMFFRIPTVLVSESGDRTFGRIDVLPLLQSIDMAYITWQTFTSAA